MTKRLFIFGLGYSGLEIARLATAAGWSVAGTVTGADKAERLAAEGIETHLFDGTAALAASALDDASHILCTIAPGTAGDPALRTCAPQLRDARWLGYLSTTGVYGDHGGGWVDETTPPRPASRAASNGWRPSSAWQAMGAHGSSGCPESMAPAAAPSTGSKPAPRGASTSPARSSRASMSRISRPRCWPR